jgi:hypothetical protein
VLAPEPVEPALGGIRAAAGGGHLWSG